MEIFIETYIKEVKELLRNGEDLYYEELEMNYKELQERYSGALDVALEKNIQIPYEEENIVPGLLTKLDRIHSFQNYNFNRDPYSKLAGALDIFGCGFAEPNCEYAPEDFPEITKRITLFMAKRSKKSEEPGVLPSLLTGNPKIQVTQEQMINIAYNLQETAKDFVAYIEEYKPEGWCWRRDTKIIGQYLFEKICELTYKKAKGIDLSDYYYELPEAFEYYEFDIPERLQNRIDGNVSSLERVVDDTLDLVDSQKFNTCEFEYWLRPILYNIGVIAIQFTLETDL